MKSVFVSEDHSFVVTSYSFPKRNDNKEIVWYDKEKSLSEMCNEVESISFFVPAKDGFFLPVSLTKKQVMDIFIEISRVENLTVAPNCPY